MLRHQHFVFSTLPWLLPNINVEKNTSSSKFLVIKMVHFTAQRQAFNAKRQSLYLTLAFAFSSLKTLQQSCSYLSGLLRGMSLIELTSPLNISSLKSLFDSRNDPLKYRLPGDCLTVILENKQDFIYTRCTHSVW